MSSRLKPAKKVQPQEEFAETPSTTSPQNTDQTPNAQPEPTVTRREGLKILMDNPENVSVIRKFIIVTILMFTLPLASFFGFKYLDYAGMPLLHMYFKDRNLVGALGSLAVIQILIGYYIYSALTEPDERMSTGVKQKKE